MSLTSPNKFLRRAYGWSVGATFVELSSGENTHLLVTTPKARFVVRRYRTGVRTNEEIEAELVWMVALRDRLEVPKVIPNIQGELFTVGDARTYAVFEFVEGEWLEPTPEHYRQLGRILRALHDEASRVSKPPTWPGWTRPVYDAQRVITRSRKSLLAAPFLNAKDKAKVEKLADKLSDLWPHLPAEHLFIHADVHLGNVLKHSGKQGDRYTLLDFDECGFGPRALDIGAARLHPVAEGTLEDVWPTFVEGYGALDDDEVRLGTALRFFYMMGKIPQRLDHPDLKKNPAERLRRYLEYVEGELAFQG